MWEKIKLLGICKVKHIDNYFNFIVSVRTLENAKATGNFAAETSEVSLSNSKSDPCYPRESESDTSDCEQSRTLRRPKKLKVGNGSLH